MGSCRHYLWRTAHRDSPNLIWRIQVETELPFARPHLKLREEVIDALAVEVSGINTYKNDHRSWQENRGAVEQAGAQIGERLIGLSERIVRGLGDDSDFRHQA